MDGTLLALVISGAVGWWATRCCRRWAERRDEIAACAPHDFVVLETHDWTMPNHVCTRCRVQKPAKELGEQRLAEIRERKGL